MIEIERQFQTDDSSDFRLAVHIQHGLALITEFQTRIHIGKSDTLLRIAVKSGGRIGERTPHFCEDILRHPGAVVRDLDHQISTLLIYMDVDKEFLVIPRETVHDRIFHEGLQCKLQERIPAVGFTGIYGIIELVLKPDLLDLKIMGDMDELIIKSGRIFFRFNTVSHHLAERIRHNGDLGQMIERSDARDRLQDVVEKMRVDLGLERFHLGVLLLYLELVFLLDQEIDPVEHRVEGSGELADLIGRDNAGVLADIAAAHGFHSAGQLLCGGGDPCGHDPCHDKTCNEYEHAQYQTVYGVATDIRGVYGPWDQRTDTPSGILHSDRYCHILFPVEGDGLLGCTFSEKRDIAGLFGDAPGRIMDDTPRVREYDGLHVRVQVQRIRERDEVRELYIKVEEPPVLITGVKAGGLADDRDYCAVG